MAKGGSINFDVGFNVDSKSLKDLKQELASIQKMTSKDLVGNFSTNDALQQIQKVEQAAAQMQNVLQKSFNTNLNTVNITKFREQLNKIDLGNIYSAMQSVGTAGTNAFRDWTSQILTTNMQLKSTQSVISSLGQTLANTVKWNIASSAVNKLSSEVQNAFSYVKALDSSLNDIQIVTNKSSSEMSNFAIEANKTAKMLGQQTTAYTNAALIYYQQGLGDQQVKALADTTLKIANITGQATQQVSEQVTAVMNGYQIEADKVQGVMDKLAAVAATTASDLQEVSSGMSKVASAANSMGVGVDSLNAQLATIVSVTRQAPESVGTALKTIYARLADLKIAGPDGVDEFGVSLGKVSEQLAQAGIQILDTNGDLRNMEEVMNEVGSSWDNWSKSQQVAVAEAMAGKRQYNNLIALFDNWDMYTDALNTSLQANGTINQQNAIYLDSISAKMNQLSAAGQDLKDSLIKADDIKGVIDAGTGLVNTLAKIVNLLGGGTSALTAFGGILTNVFSKSVSDNFIMPMINGLDNFINKINQTEKVTAFLNKYQAELTNQGIDTGRTKEIVEIKRQELALSQSLTQQQHKQVDSTIKQIAEESKKLSVLQNEQKTLIGTKDKEGNIKGGYLQQLRQKYDEKAQKYDLKDLTQSSKFIDRASAGQDWINSEKEKFAQVKTSVEDARTSLTLLRETLSDSSKTYQDYVQAVELSKGQIDQLKNSTDKLALSTQQQQMLNKKYAEIQEANSKVEEARKLVDATVAGSQQRIQAQQQVKQAVNDSKKAYQQYVVTVEDMTGANQQNALALEKLLNNANPSKINQLANNIKAFKQNIEETQDTLKQGQFRGAAIEKLSSSITKIVGASAQGAMGVKILANGIKQLGDDSLTAGQKVETFITTIAMSGSMIGNAITSIGSALREAHNAYKVLSTITKAGQSLTAVESLKGGFEALKGVLLGTDLAASGVTTTLGGLMGAIGIVTGVVAAAVVGIKLYVDWLNRYKTAAENAQQAANQQQQQYDNLKSSYDQLKSSIEKYQSALDAISSLTRGTQEWRDAISDANQQMLALLQTYPQLSQYITTTRDGLLQIGEDNLEAFKNAQNAALVQQQAATASSNMAARQAINTSNANDIAEKGKRSIHLGVNENFMDEYFQFTPDDIKALVGNEDIYKALTESTQDNYDTLMTALSENLSNLGLDELTSHTEELASYLMDNQASLIDLKNSMDENSQASKIAAQQVVDSTLQLGKDEGSKAYQQSDYKGIISSILGNQYQQRYQQAYNKYQDKGKFGGGLTDEEIQAQYASMMGYEGHKNAKDNKGKYLIDGEWTQVNDETARQALASAAAMGTFATAAQTAFGEVKGISDQATEVTAEVQQWADAAKEFKDTEITGGKTRDISDLILGGVTNGQFDFGSTPLDIVDGFEAEVKDALKKTQNGSKQELLKGIFPSGMDVKAYAEAMGIDTEAQDWAQQVLNKMSDAIKANKNKPEKALQDVNAAVRDKIKEFKDKLTLKDSASLTANQQTAMIKPLQDVYMQFGTEGASKVEDLFKGVSEQNAQGLVDLISGADFSSYEGIQNLSNAIQEQAESFNLDSTAAQNFIGWLQQVNNTASNVSSQLDSQRDKISSALKVSDKVSSTGTIISDKDMQSLVAFDSKIKDLFSQTADGWKLTSSVQTFKNELQQSLPPLDELKSKFEQASKAAENLVKYQQQNSRFKNDVRTTDTKTESARQASKFADSNEDVMKEIGMSSEVIENAYNAIRKGPNTEGYTDALGIIADFYNRIDNFVGEYNDGMLDASHAEQVYEDASQRLSGKLDQQKDSFENLNTAISTYASLMNSVKDLKLGSVIDANTVALLQKVNGFKFEGLSKLPDGTAIVTDAAAAQKSLAQASKSGLQQQTKEINTMSSQASSLSANLKSVPTNVGLSDQNKRSMIIPKIQSGDFDQSLNAIGTSAQQFISDLKTKTGDELNSYIQDIISKLSQLKDFDPTSIYYQFANSIKDLNTILPENAEKLGIDVDALTKYALAQQDATAQTAKTKEQLQTQQMTGQISPETYQKYSGGWTDSFDQLYEKFPQGTRDTEEFADALARLVSTSDQLTMDQAKQALAMLNQLMQAGIIDGSNYADVIAKLLGATTPDNYRNVDELYGDKSLSSQEKRDNADKVQANEWQDKGLNYSDDQRQTFNANFQSEAVYDKDSQETFEQHRESLQQQIKTTEELRDKQAKLSAEWIAQDKKLKQLNQDYDDFDKEAKDRATSLAREQKGAKNITDNYEDWAKSIKDFSKNGQKASKASAELNDALEDVLDLPVGTKLSDDFSKKHLDLVEDYANGVQGAFDKIQAAAAQDILIGQGASVSPELSSAIDQVSTEINTLPEDEWQDFEIGEGSYVSDSLYNACNQILEQTASLGGNVDANMAAVAAALGMDVQLQHKSFPATVFGPQYTQGASFKDEATGITYTSISPSVNQATGMVDAVAIKAIRNNGSYGGGISGGGGGGGGCFVAGTLISTPDGGFKEIQDVQIGDVVLSYNEILHVNEYSEVLETMIHYVTEDIYTLYIQDIQIEVTGIHQFYIDRDGDERWIHTYDLQVGDSLRFADGTHHSIQKITKDFRTTTVYNFEVSHNHNYYVSGKRVLAHNKGCFVAGTPITAMHGMINIENIKIGDWVLSYNQKSHTNEYSQVLDTMTFKVQENMYKIHINNTTLQVTGVHKFLITRYGKEQWIAAGQLQVGDKVRFANGEHHIIDDITIEYKTVQVYNFEVSGNHNYYVGKDQVLAHNKGGKKGGGGKGKTSTISAKQGKHVTDQKDAYKTIEKSIDKTNDTLDKLDKASDKAFGKSKISNLQKMNQQLQKQNKLYSRAKTGLIAIAQAQKNRAKTATKNSEILQDAGISKETQLSYQKKGSKDKKEYTVDMQKYISDLNLGSVLQSYNGDNYDSIFQQAKQMVNAQIDKNNVIIKRGKGKKASNKNREAATTAQAQNDALSAWWSGVFSTAIQQFDEAAQKQKQARQQIQDNVDQMYQNNLQAFTIKVTAKLDLTQLQKDWADFKKSNKLFIDQNDFKAIAEADIEKINTALGEKGSIKTNADAAKRASEAVKKLSNPENQKGIARVQADLAAGRYDNDEGYKRYKADLKQYTDEKYGTNLQQAKEDLQTYIKQGQQAIQDVQDSINDLYDQWNSSLQKISDKYERQISLIDSENELLQHNKKLATLIYGEKNYAMLKKYTDQQAKIDQDKIDLLTHERDKYQTLINQEKKYQSTIDRTTETGQKKWKESQKRLQSLQDKFIDTTKSLYSTIDQAIQHQQDALNNQWNKFKDERIKNVLDTERSLDDVVEEWQMINDNAERYLDTINSGYSLKSLQNAFDKALNSTQNSVKAQRELNALKDKQLSKLRQKDKLSQYDIDRVNKMLILQQKRLALEDAKQNKSQLKLRRDAQGNYSYQYAADKDKTTDARQEYLQAQNDVYNLDKQRFEKIQQEYVTQWQNFLSTTEDLRNRAMQGDQQAQAQYDALSKQFVASLQGIAQDYDEVRSNLMDSTAQSYTELFDKEKMAAENLAIAGTLSYNQLSMAGRQAVSDILNNSVPGWTGSINTMITKLSGDDDASLKSNVEALSQEIKDQVDAQKEKIGQLISSQGNSLTDLQNAVDNNKDSVDDYKSSLEALDQESNNYMTTMGTMVSNADELVKKLGEQKGVVDSLTSSYKELVSIMAEASEASQDIAVAQESGNPRPIVSNPGPGSPSPGPIGPNPGPGSPIKVGSKITISKNAAIYKDKNSKKKNGTIGKKAKTATVKEINGNRVGIKGTTKQGGKDKVYWVDISKVSLYKKKTTKKTTKGKKTVKKFDTGGYTGNWNSNQGRMAILHEKELVLNKADTANILQAVNIVRDLNEALNSIQGGYSLGSFANNLGNMNNSSGVSQNIQITAQFPNAVNHSEIQQALLNLANKTSQYIGR